MLVNMAWLRSWRRGYRDGFLGGFKEGVKETETRMRRKLVRQCLRYGMSVEQIVDLLEISLREGRRLAGNSDQADLHDAEIAKNGRKGKMKKGSEQKESS